MLDEARIHALKLLRRYDPSVIPFQKAHGLYIKNLLQKVEKIQLFINRIFKLVKKLAKKPQFFAAHAPKLYEQYRQI